jgi:hypothetical protein
MEIILLIIENLVSTPSAIYPAYDLVTKTLVAFTTVCSQTSSTASRLLWKHCMYIDSSRRARYFVEHLTSLWPPTIHERGPVRLFLRPFDNIASEESTDDDEEQPQLSSSIDREGEGVDEYELIGSPTSTQSSEWPPSPLDDLPTATLVQDMFRMLAPVLTSLIIDMPLRSLYPESDHRGVRKVLRHGFELLVNLEEFVSVRDELYLATVVDWAEAPVWSMCWPLLRRIALYNPLVEMAQSSDDEGNSVRLLLERLPQLELAVLTRSDGDFRNAYVDTGLEGYNPLLPRSKTLTWAFVDCKDKVTGSGGPYEKWRKIGEVGGKTQIVTMTLDSLYHCWKYELPPEGVDAILLSQEWVLQESVAGTLWEKAKHGIGTI